MSNLFGDEEDEDVKTCAVCRRALYREANDRWYDGFGEWYPDVGYSSETFLFFCSEECGENYRILNAESAD